MERPKPLRGEVWMFDLNPNKGREQKGVRPCLVVSTDALNRSDFGTVIICPITTTERLHFKWRVPVALRHLATVINEERLRSVDDSLRMMLNL